MIYFFHQSLRQFLIEIFYCPTMRTDGFFFILYYPHYISVIAKWVENPRFIVVAIHSFHLLKYNWLKKKKKKTYDTLSQNEKFKIKYYISYRIASTQFKFTIFKYKIIFLFLQLCLSFMNEDNLIVNIYIFIFLSRQLKQTEGDGR